MENELYIKEAQEKISEIIAKSGTVVFFGGAGMSTESGIPDFRSADGLYTNPDKKYRVPPETIISHSFFTARPELFYEFYREKMIFPDAEPNPAHYKLAEMEEKGKLNAVITQNIDGLHQKAGSRRVLELHGSTLRNYCQKCRKKYTLDAITGSTGIPRCSCGGIIRPDVVLYEEGLDQEIMRDAIMSIMAADTMIVAGTSLTVYPAAGLVEYFSGENLILINRDETPLDRAATLAVHESVGKVLGNVVVS